MKTILKLALLILLPTIAQAQSGWNLVFSDEFNGGSLNTSVWGTTYPGGGQCTQQNEDEVYQPGAFSAGGGNLSVTTTNNGAYADDGGGFICPGPWESGLIQSNGSNTFTYGYFEERAKIPSGAGFWPAFWLYATSGYNGPEIDIMEMLNTATTTVYQTYHATPPQQDQNVATSGVDCNTTYCTFAVDWEPGVLKFYLNGTLTYTYTNADVSSTAMYILSNLAVGGAGSFPGSWDGSTPSPASMTVDYIRVYKHPSSGSGCYSVIPGPTPIPTTGCGGGGGGSPYYVDYTTGNDSNAGTSTGSPWKHAPGMLGLTPSGSSTGDGCTATCASTTINPGDAIILKGGTVWPYTTMPWAMNFSGSSSSQSYGCAGAGCIYIGNAVGAGLAAWNNGTVTSITLKRDLGGWNPGSPPTISCSGGGGSGAAAIAHIVPAANTDGNLSGFIYNIALTSGGSSYTSAPTCGLSGSGIATLSTDINRAIVDWGSTQGSPPDWPLGNCSGFPNTCYPGINISGNYIVLSGIEARNMLTVTNNGGGGISDVEYPYIGEGGSHITVTNVYNHGLFWDCVSNNVNCSNGDANFFAISPGSFGEVANSIVSNSDATFAGTSGQQSAGVCNTNTMCSTVSFGIGTCTSCDGPLSVHGNVIYANVWQLRFNGQDSSGSLPYLSYGNELWFATTSANTTDHINARYMQIGGTTTLISYNNIVHNMASGGSSQIQCPSGVTFDFYNEVQWAIGTGTQPYSADMADVSGTGGCTMNLYNDTMYANNGGSCINSQPGTNVTNITMQNLHCITTPGANNPFWSTGITNSNYQTSGGSNVQANVQAASVVQSIGTANSQGYVNNNLFSPVGSSGATVQFVTSSGTANLTSLCSGNFSALCYDINGTSRPSSGGWQAGAYYYGGGILNPAANPSCSPGTGSYSSTQSVTCSTSSGGAIICYTTSGATPATNGSSGCTTGILYSSAISISSTATLKAIAGGSGYLDSSVVSYVYTITVPTASTPSCSPGSGTYTSTQSVTCSASTGPTLCYTVNGTAPQTNGTTGCTTGTLYSGAISVASSETLKVVAGGTGFLDGSVSTYTYVITTIAANPSCSPGTGSYTGTQLVSCTFSSPGSIGCYTTNGTTPATNGGSGCTTGTKYSGTISVVSSETLKIISGGSGYTDSSVVTYTYTISGPPTASTPVCVPGSGIYYSTQMVGCTAATGPTLCYTTNGTTPATNGTTGCTTGTHYTTTISVSASETLKVITGGTGFTDGPVATYTYTITSPFAGTPVCTPPAGTYPVAQSVTCSVSSGPVICYTTDSSTPATNGTTGCNNGTKYTTAITVSSSETIKAIAGGTSYTDGSVASYTYAIVTVTPSAPWPLSAYLVSGNHSSCPICKLLTGCICQAKDGFFISINGSSYAKM